MERTILNSEPFSSDRPFPARDGTTLRLWGTAPPAEAAEGHEGGQSRYFKMAQASDSYFDLLGETQGAKAPARQVHLPHAPRPDMPSPGGDGPDAARARSHVARRLHKLLGNPVTDKAALHRWREARRADLDGIVKSKLHECHVMKATNGQMGKSHRSTLKALHDFNKASHTATQRPEYFRHSMRNLISSCQAYGDLVGSQLGEMKEMARQNASIGRAGGERPHVAMGRTPDDGAGEEVSGPMSADVEQATAERQIGSFEMADTRSQVCAGISTIRAAVDAMKHGLSMVKDVQEGRGRGMNDLPGGIKQKDAPGVPNAPVFHVESEELGVKQVEGQLSVMQQDYDELVNLGMV